MSYHLGMRTQRSLTDAASAFSYRPTGDTPCGIGFRTFRSTLTLGAGQVRYLNQATDLLSELGTDVVVRDNGGGAVWIEPEAQIWVGIYLPSTEGFLTEDYRAELVRIGEVIAPALVSFGLSDVRVVRSPDLLGRGKELCFAGLSYGEITTSGKKILGLSLRRTKRWKIFHLMVPVYETQDKAASVLLRLGKEVPSAVTWSSLSVEIDGLKESDLSQLEEDILQRIDSRVL
ncbi:lipoyl protein ligase domain-containing protein [Ferrithrix thermotolerans]|uniref:lipoyl protein ligase domain-containing protein n=1 Tax=Ferrithrix thermotolerans TaxID=209649 RepID=UPI001160988E|nr:hypothetical protein [Ferrithrix thermotolerans]